ncbi:MAG: ATP-binding protein [Dehalococcoidia bacterium]|nr:ATP-binding protein [Dehalococcoidia bacterium]
MTAPIRVLLIEDNPGDARLIREMLAESRRDAVELEWADRLWTGLTRLAASATDAVLLDLGLPESGGLDTFLKMHAEAPDTPIVVLTGNSDETVALEAVHRGAQDYLVKGQVDGKMLLHSLRYAIERHGLLVQLERTAAELELKNQELDAFARTVSHDLKEPLRAIQAFSQFLLEEYASRLDGQGRDYVEMVGKASARMKTLIDDLLTFSRIGCSTDPPERIDVAQVVRDIIEDNRLAIGERQADIDIEGKLPAVQGDRTRIEQIFTNLIGNGLKFNKDARPRVTVGMRGSDDAMATLYVRDNGIGIDPQYHERIFGVFQRLHRREDYEGTGAGLSIVKRAVESFGGKVWLESRPGAGSTFLFTLPLWTPEAEPKGEAA